YRVAHGIHERAQQHQASTEDLREALLRYRSLFEELLRPADADAHVAGPAEQAVPEPRRPVSDPALGDRPASDRPLSDGPNGGRPARSGQATDVEASDDAH